jgi:hypothetical protein
VPERFRDRITSPDVQYYSHGGCWGVPNYHTVDYVDSDSPDASVAQCPAGDKIRPSQVFVDAEHLINIPLLKSHGSYITLALKNHYGSVIYRDNTLGSMHEYFNQGGNKQSCDLETENILADINDNPHIRDKTRLVIGDGLFGNSYTNGGSVERWDIFNNDDPNILFFSADPVAISSVMTDYIVAERGNQDHEHLHAAATLGLGVHEQWDNATNRKYTEIDYVVCDPICSGGATPSSTPTLAPTSIPTETPVPTNTPTSTQAPVAGDATGDGNVDVDDYRVWVNNYNTSTQGGSNNADFNIDGKVDGEDFVIWLINYGI